MAFEFTSGPKSTKRSIEDISQIIKRIGEGKQFMGVGRRLNTSAIGPGAYGPFVPTASTDPFASARSNPDFSVGWAWGNSVTNAWGMTLRQGWEVVFEVFDEGSTRKVSGRATGKSSKGDAVRLVDMVFGEL